MIKSELVTRIAAAHPRLFKRDADVVVAAILDAIAEALQRGKRVELRGFCTLSTKRIRARTGRNPTTGKAIAVIDKAAIHCRTGSELAKRLNEADARGFTTRARRSASRLIS